MSLPFLAATAMSLLPSAHTTYIRAITNYYYIIPPEQFTTKLTNNDDHIFTR